MKMYTNIRRKAKDDIDLQPVTITLPTAVLIDLANAGVESGRGGGNVSTFIEIATMVVLGIFTDTDTALEYITRLVRTDINTKDTLLELADRVDDLAQRIRMNVL